MVHRDDLDASIRLLAAFIEEGHTGDFRIL
jgi:hypothetical protein